MSFLTAPAVLVTIMDEDVDISMVFNLVEEETKETKEKSNLTGDDFFHSGYRLPKLDPKGISIPQTFYDQILSNLYLPGEVAPPPEFS